MSPSQRVEHLFLSMQVSMRALHEAQPYGLKPCEALHHSQSSGYAEGLGKQSH